MRIVQRPSALLWTATVSWLACGTESVANPPATNEPNFPAPELVARITGDTLLGIFELGAAVTGVWDGRSSQNNVPITYEWTAQIRDDPFEDILFLGVTETVSFEFARPGLYVIELTIRAGGTSATDELELLVTPPEISDDLYDHPLAFFRFEYPESGQPTPALYFMNLGSAAYRVFGSQGLNTHTLTWEPNGQRLALSFGGAATRIYTYDITTGDFKPISEFGTPSETGLQREPSWSPTGDWIAFTDDSRFPRNEKDELVIVRPDGSEQIYLAGESPDTVECAFCGFYPSWAPDGESIALGNVRFQVGPGDDRVRRIAIFSDLWSGSPVKNPVHTEDQLEEFIMDLGYTDQEYFETLQVGTTGVAWSPDGTELAFHMIFGRDSDVHSIIAKSAVDGSGLILVADEGVSNTKPAWSPDGAYIFYLQAVPSNIASGTEFHIMRTPADRPGAIDLSGADKNDVSPRIYG